MTLIVLTLNIFQSHTNNEAYWNGRCQLTEEQQKLHMVSLFSDADEDLVTEAMADLGT